MTPVACIESTQDLLKRMYVDISIMLNYKRTHHSTYYTVIILLFVFLPESCRTAAMHMHSAYLMQQNAIFTPGTLSKLYCMHFTLDIPFPGILFWVMITIEFRMIQ